jgi:AsmA protein
MPRRRILIVVALTLVALSLGIAPWTITAGRLNAAVARQVRAVYGLDLAIDGRTTIAVLPVPRVKFENVILSAAGTPLISGAQLRGDLRVLPLFGGKLDLAELSLNEADVRVAIEADGTTSWDPVITHVRQRMQSPKATTRHIRRLVVTNATLSVADKRRGSHTDVTDINLLANWPLLDGTLNATGSGRWRGENVQLSLSNFRPVAFVAGRRTRFDAEASGPIGRAAFSIDANLRDELHAIGRASLTTRSVRDFLHWTGFQIPFGALLSGATLTGDFTADRKGIAWPAVQLTLGADRLDGAVSARLEGGRLALAGTLAAERLNLPDQLPSLSPLWTLGSPWSSEPIDLTEMTGADVDLRLSATNARIGTLKLEEVAANLLVRPGRVEISLGRATLNRGFVKGRLALEPAARGHDVKLQGSFDRLDVGGLLIDLGVNRWLSGIGQGQVNVEAVGESAANLVARAQGRVTLSVRHGDFWGISLVEALRRAERRPLSAPLEWRGGRTPFDTAQIVLNLRGGIGDIVDGQVAAPPVRAALQGQISFLERSMAIRAQVDAAPGPGAGASPSLTLDVTGPWGDVAVSPDARSLIERSGSARQLLTSEPR